MEEPILNATMVRMFGCPRSKNAHIERKKSKCDYLLTECPADEHVAQIEAALKEDMPVLGICRGIQLINAALGGTLWQDLPSEHPSEIVHRQDKPYDNTVHTVSLQGKLKEPLGKETLRVNSRHHQAVRILSPMLSFFSNHSSTPAANDTHQA